MIDKTERLCNRCGRGFYEKDLDEYGFCEECRELEDMGWKGGEDATSS